MVATTLAGTAVVVMGNVAVVPPAAIVAVAGTWAAGLSLLKATVAPPAGAARVRVSVPTEDWPPGTRGGIRTSFCSVGASTVRVRRRRPAVHRRREGRDDLL